MRRLCSILAIAVAATPILAQSKTVYEMRINGNFVGTVTNAVRQVEFEGQKCTKFESVTEPMGATAIASGGGLMLVRSEYDSWVAPDGRPIRTVSTIGDGTNRLVSETRVTGNRVKTMTNRGQDAGLSFTELTPEEARLIRGTLDGVLEDGVPKQDVQRSLVIDPLTGKPKESVRTVLGKKTIVHRGESVETTVVESALYEKTTARRMLLYFDSSGRLLLAQGDGKVELIRLPDPEEKIGG
jgi:hypothetical protein